MRISRFQGVLLAFSAVFVFSLLLVVWLRPHELVREKILLGTFVQIKVYGTDLDALNEAVEDAFAEIQRIQERFSRAGVGALAQLNQAEPGTSVPISQELLTLLELAQHYQTLSQGAFDPALGQLEDLWGFVEDWDGTGRVPSETEIKRFLALPRGFTLNAATSEATRVSANTQIDLGGIAKGYAVDRALEVLQSHPVQAALVNAGGNVRTVGQVPEPTLFWVQFRPFQVGVQHPRRSDGVVGGLTLTSGQGVATSGDYQRYFMLDGVRYHHILDPQSGYPANKMMSSTVIAPTALEADALSTAVFVLGPEAGIALINTLPEVEAVLITQDGNVFSSRGLDGKQFSL